MTTALGTAQPFIVCELGSNWRNLADITNAVHLIKAMGADALKLQAFSNAALYGRDPRPPALYDDLADVEPEGTLPLAWLPLVKEKCDKAGLEFMCSAFSPELVAAVDPFVEVHKVASSEVSYPQLLEAVAKTGKPVLLSTGASHAADIAKAVALLPRDRTTLLYCNAAYPSRHHDLFQIETLRTMFGLPVGYSDHSIDTYSPLSAVRHFGATVVEKHFTPITEVNTPDRGHSLAAADFKVMCDLLRGKTAPGEFQPSREESAMFLRHNRRLLASVDIAAGEQLAFGKNYGAFRSVVDDTVGLSPWAWVNVENKRAVADIKAGDPIGPGSFK